MSNVKHYPTHPGAEHTPIMKCEIPLEEYESLKRENAELKDEINELRVDLEGAKATAYAESVDAGMENRRLKRALWLARKAHAVAMFAYWDSHYRDNPNAVYRNRTIDWLRNRWLLILDAIIKKEKEYK